MSRSVIFLGVRPVRIISPEDAKNLPQWFKKFYIAIKPNALTAMFFDES